MSQSSPQPRDRETQLLDSVRSILRGEDKARLDALEEELNSVEQKHLEQQQRLRDRIGELEAQLAKNQLQLDQQIASLQADVQTVEAKVVPAVTKGYASIVTDAIGHSHAKVAEAHAPIIGPAIRQQIRDSRDDMVEALSPIVFDSVGRAISEFRREIQRNIDAQYQATFGAQSIFRGLRARSRGISAADLALRDALPFTIEQIFIIERDSGLLIAHHSQDASGTDDSDLIGGMLTAIRDFVSDSFSGAQQQEELNEIQYGDSSVIIQTGQLIYAAAVVNGNEPPGFRAELRSLVSNLHLEHGDAIRSYEGDPTTVAMLNPEIEAFGEGRFEESNSAPKPLSKNARRAIFGTLLALMVLMSCAFIQLWINAQYLGLIPGPGNSERSGRATLVVTDKLPPNLNGSGAEATFMAPAGPRQPSPTLNIQMVSTTGAHLFTKPNSEMEPFVTLPRNA